MATTAETLRRTNEVPGTRAILRNYGTSAYKARAVLDVIRGKTIQEALDILRFTDRGPAVPIAKLLNSAVANAVENDGMDKDELFVAGCFADEGVTAKRWRPRARGRAGRIRKRSSHLTIIVARLPEDRLEHLRSTQEEAVGSRRSRVSSSRADRVAKSSRTGEEAATADETTDVSTEVEAPEAFMTEIENNDNELVTETAGTTIVEPEEVEETLDVASSKKNAADDAKEEGK